MMSNKERNLIISIFAAFCLFFSLVLGKAFYLQVINSSLLIEKANKQFIRVSKIFPNRGSIFDRNGSPLAINIRTYTIIAIPKLVKNPAKTYRALAKIVPQLPYERILRKVRGRDNYTFLARKIQLKDELAAQVKPLEDDGVYIESVPKRYYPNHELVAQTVGFVGVDNKGLAGIEDSFDTELRGEEIVAKYLQDAKGRPIKFESQHTEQKAQDIYLSIDKEVQSVAEKYLKESVDINNATRGGIGIMDASTGEILAMANYPAFDPNDYYKYDLGVRKLAFISDPFEPGSAFKTLTISSALENKVSRPDTSYYCEKGSFRVENHIINEAEEKEKFEWMTVSEILQHSSNIGTTKIAFDLTFPRLRKSLKTFGIGLKTGIELPGESRGIFTDKENVRPLSLSNMSFGQGIATTAIQMLSFYAAIANDGLYNKPTILKGGNAGLEPRRIVTEKTAKEVQKMLLKAVDDGTGLQAQIKYFKIGGKTSTAQRVAPEGGYSGHIPGFIGFPINVEKKFVIYVYVDNPKKGIYYGNLVAAPVFREVAQYLLYKNKDFNEVKVSEVSDEAEEAVGAQIVGAAKKRDYGPGFMPDLIGLDKVSVGNYLLKSNLSAQHLGIGVVSKQYPEPGAAVTSEATVRIYYEPPKYE